MTTKRALEYNQIKEIIENKQLPLRTKALIAVQYGTGARVGEILPYKNSKNKLFDGLKKSDIIDKGEYLEVRLPNFKNKYNTTKDIPLVKTETWLIAPIIRWIQICSTEVLFKLHQRRARQIIKDAVGFSSHYLRHSRATHLAQIFHYDAYEIKKTLGHAKLDTSQIYVDVNPQLMIEKIKKQFSNS